VNSVSVGAVGAGRPQRRGLVLGVVSGVAGLLSVVVLLLVPMYATETCSGSSSSPVTTCSTGSAGLLAVNPGGWMLLAVLAVAAVGIAVGAAAGRKWRWLLLCCTVIWCGISFLGLLSIGLFLLPAAALALAATIRALSG
jgi:hypothetical protein